jgi:hypothetical protein
MYLVVDVIDVVDPVSQIPLPQVEELKAEEPVKKSFLSIMDIVKTIFDILLWLLLIVYLYHGLTLVGILD